ncbi:amidohydrolase family protein [Sphingopyxis sp. LK2115]|jgi:predicted TIM-barrel fold metal-dependent hydrolase|uniref:amidohydrolase family protein n=1 Tax=Sphingopyxis sp. LK2115 TaxID=2744558 RepID=UPI0016603440|nr:amidohydrolase family protein [Sphingopyxis sp. LK2115]
MRTLLLSLALFAPFASVAAEDRVIDTHVHLWNGAESVADYRAKLKAAGLSVERFGAMWFGGPNQARAGNPADISARNDALIALAKDHPDMIPIATVHPYDGEAALAEVTRVAGRGVKILKIHPHTQGFDAADPRVLALVQHAGAAGMVVLLDNGGIVPADNEKLFNLALAAPKTRFILAHMGGLGFRFWNILALARTAEGLFGENIYFDISASVILAADSPIEDEYVWTIRNVGIDQVLIASDYPQISLAKTLDALDKLDLTEEERAKIRSGNAKRLLGL